MVCLGLNGPPSMCGLGSNYWRKKNASRQLSFICIFCIQTSFSADFCAYICLPIVISRETYRLAGRYQCTQIAHIFYNISSTSGINPFAFTLRCMFAVMKSYVLVINICLTTESGGFPIILPKYDNFILSMIDSIDAQPIKHLAVIMSFDWRRLYRFCNICLYFLDFTQICCIQNP